MVRHGTQQVEGVRHEPALRAVLGRGPEQGHRANVVVCSVLAIADADVDPLHLKGVPGAIHLGEHVRRVGPRDGGDAGRRGEPGAQPCPSGGVGPSVAAGSATRLSMACLCCARADFTRAGISAASKARPLFAASRSCAT